MQFLVAAALEGWNVPRQSVAWHLCEWIGSGRTCYVGGAMLAKFARLLASSILRCVPERRWLGTLQAVLAQAPERLKLLQGVLTMWGSLENLKAIGFTPRVVIDVGAWSGAWTARVHQIFPSAEFLMVEANPDKQQTLEAVAARLGPTVKLRMALVGSEPRAAVTFYAMETGSSVLPETSGFERTVLSLPMSTLDEVCSASNLQGPILLKADVQGYELEVLRGGPRALSLVEVVLLEVSLLEYNAGAPLMVDVVSSLNSAGFVPYDVCGQLRRESDGALGQLDIIFVRRDSPLRAKKPFWNSDPKAGHRGPR